VVSRRDPRHRFAKNVHGTLRPTVRGIFQRTAPEIVVDVGSHGRADRCRRGVPRELSKLTGKAGNMKSYPAATRVAKVELLIAFMSWLTVFGLIAALIAEALR
jgi:hypothetical protein